MPEIEQSSSSTGYMACSGLKVSALLILYLITVLARFIPMYAAGIWQEPLSHMGMPAEEIVLAQNILAGNGYTTPYGSPETKAYRSHPSAHSAPAYPYLLAGILKVSQFVFSDSRAPYRVAILTNIAVNSVTPVLLGVVVAQQCGQLGFWMTGVISVIAPQLVRNAYILWDTPFVWLGMSLALAVAVLFKPPTSAIAWLFGGVVCGLLLLFNPNLAPVLGTAGIFMVIQIRPRHQALHRAFILGLTVLAVLMPWTIRNKIEFGRWIPIRNNLGLELWLGNQDDADGTTLTACQRHPGDDPVERQLVDEIGDDRYMELKKRKATEWILAHPRDFARLTGCRMVYYWFGNIFNPDPLGSIPMGATTNIGIGRFCSGIITLLASLWGVYLWKSVAGRAVYAAGILVTPIPYYLTHVSPTYRDLVAPLLICTTGILLSVAGRHVWLKVVNRKRTTT